MTSRRRPPRWWWGRAGQLAVALTLLVIVVGVVSGTGTSAGAPAGSPSSARQTDTRLPPALRFRLRADDGVALKPNAPNIALSGVANGPLLLFLPATGHVPADYSRFLAEAHAEGYHVLGLDYFNLGHSVSAICHSRPTCYAELQRNRFLGSGPSAFSRVDETNGIEDRLVASLEHLQQVDPSGGWGAYLHKEQVDWSDIVVAGHSQGGGQAAYIAHVRPVLGQLTFSSPILFSGLSGASWIRTPGRTPTSRMFLFVDEHDHFFPQIVRTIDALGLNDSVLRAPDPVPVRTVPHVLISTTNLGSPGASHLRTVTDRTPLGADGRPVYLGVWRWMLQRFAPRVG